MELRDLLRPQHRISAAREKPAVEKDAGGTILWCDEYFRAVTVPSSVIRQGSRTASRHETRFVGNSFWSRFERVTHLYAVAGLDSEMAVSPEMHPLEIDILCPGRLSSAIHSES